MTDSKSNLHQGHRSRMREKLMASNAQQTLCDHELLEILLYYAIPQKDTNPLAHELLAYFGSLDKLFQANTAELMQIGGVGERTAALIKTVFHLHERLNFAVPDEPILQTFEEIGSYFVKLFGRCDSEKSVLLLFDKKGRIDRSVILSEGLGDLAPIKMKKLVASSVSSSAVSAALAHNHPGGTLVASYEDKSATLLAEELLRSLGIRLIEHYIITDGRYFGIKHNTCGTALPLTEINL